MTEGHHGYRGQTNIKVATYNPLTGETHTEHKSYKSEIFYPATNRLVKTVDKVKSTRPELSDSETRVLP